MADSILDDIYPETLPWELDHGVTDEHGNSAIVDQHKVVVAFMSDDGLEEDDADDIIDARGQIMAAAPEMYRALAALAEENVVLPGAVSFLVSAALNKANGVDGDD